MSDLSALDQFKDGSQKEAKPENPEKVIAPIISLDHTRRILSFDQSLANTGWALVVGSVVFWTGNLKSKESLSGHEASLNRAVVLYNEMHSLITQAEPDLVVYETPPVGGGRMMRPESSLMAATVLRIAAAKLGIPVRMIGAQKAKKRLTGNGNAKKAEVREAIKRIDPSVMRMKPMNEGIYDAIAIAWVATEEQ